MTCNARHPLAALTCTRELPHATHASGTTTWRDHAMKLTLEFDLPQDREAAETAMHADDYVGALRSLLALSSDRDLTATDVIRVLDEHSVTLP